MGQAMVRSSVPSWPRMAIKGPSMRSVTRCPASGEPTPTCRSARLIRPVALTVRSTSITAPGAGGQRRGACRTGAAGGQPGQFSGSEPGGKGLDPGTVQQHVQADRIHPQSDLPPGQGRAEPDLLPAELHVP
jgi:hypothetical protein